MAFGVTGSGSGVGADFGVSVGEFARSITSLINGAGDADLKTGASLMVVDSMSSEEDEETDSLEEEAAAEARRPLFLDDPSFSDLEEDDGGGGSGGGGEGAVGEASDCSEATELLERESNFNDKHSFRLGH